MLEKALVALDTAEEDPFENVVAAEEILKSLENQLKAILKEMADLVEEGKTISEDVEKTRACYLAAFPSLSIPQTELETVESGCKANANFLNQIDRDSY